MRLLLKYIILPLLFSLVLSAQQVVNFNISHHEKILPFGLVEKEIDCMPKVALVLSGGGSRGLAQLGVIKALEEEGIPISIIVSTSMGSIIGGLYAAGYSVGQMDSIVSNTNWDEFFSTSETDRTELFVEQKIIEDRSLFEMRLEGITPVLPTSFNTGQKVSNFLNMLVLNAPIHITDSFDGLLYRFRAVSTDLKTGNPVILENGSLSQAMRASSSVTFLLAPIRKDSLLLVDGGLVANIPVKEAKKLGADLTIAVNTTSPLRTAEELKYPWNIADQVVSIPMKILNEEQIKEADVLIEPELRDTKNTDFTDIRNLFNLGYEETKKVVPRIKDKIDSLFTSRLGDNDRYYQAVEISGNDDELVDEIIRNIGRYDSVSIGSIKETLCNEFSKGDLKDLSAEFLKGDTLRVEILSELNPTVESVVFENVSLIDTAILNDYSKGILSQPYNSRKILKSALNFLDHYRRKGYSMVTVDSVVLLNGQLTYYLNEDTIDAVEIEGNTKTVDGVIKREIPLEAGEHLTRDKIKEGLSNLRGSNLFEEFEFAYRNNYGKDTLKIKVIERQSSLFRFGLKIDNENFTQLLFDVRDENLFGTGSELGLTLFGGSRTRSYILEHRADRILDTYLTYKIRAFYEFNDVSVYRDDSTQSEKKFSRSKTGEYRQIFKGISLGIGTQIEKVANLIFEGRFQNDEVKNKFDYFGETYKLDIGAFRVSLSIDSQDKYPYPASGFLVKGYYETAQNIFGGGISYTKTELDYRVFIGIAEDHNLKARINLGIADETLPLSQQFSFGGQNSFFGYRNDEYRGRQIFTSSLEYRYKLPFQIFFDSYIKARYDLGSIWSEKKQIRFKDLRHGIGATLSLDTPLGPADFSVGRSFIVKSSLPQSTLSWGQVFFYFTIGYYY